MEFLKTDGLKVFKQPSFEKKHDKIKLFLFILCYNNVMILKLDVIRFPINNVYRSIIDRYNRLFLLFIILSLSLFVLQYVILIYIFNQHGDVLISVHYTDRYSFLIGQRNNGKNCNKFATIVQSSYNRSFVVRK